MPLPVIAVAVWEFVAAAVSWVVRRKAWEWWLASGGVTFLSGMTDVDLDELKQKAYRVGVSMLGDAIGEDIDASRPLGQALADVLTRKTGVPIRTLFDRDSLREDLESYALDQLQAKSGYRLSSLTDASKVKGDLQDIGLQIVQDRTGIPLSGATTPDEVKAAVTSWAEASVYERLLESVPADDLLSGNDDVRRGADTLVAEIQRRAGGSVRNLSTRQVVQAINSHVLAQTLVAVVQKSDSEKVSRRRLQVRWAQKKFRERHKKREVYVPLGFEVSTKYVGGGEDG